MPRKPHSHKPVSKTARDERPSASARGYNANWRKLRAAFLLSHPMCEQPGCREAAAHVDHKDRDVCNLAVENLQALCHSCHSRKTVACDGGFGRVKKEYR